MVQKTWILTLDGEPVDVVTGDAAYLLSQSRRIMELNPGMLAQVADPTEEYHKSDEWCLQVQRDALARGVRLPNQLEEAEVDRLNIDDDN